MDDGGFWNGLGFDVVKTPAGFAGGVVAALTFNQVEPLGLLIRVVVGGLTANYLGGPAETYVAAHFYDLGHGTSFLLGICGMVLCQGAVSFAKTRMERFTKNNNGRERT